MNALENLSAIKADYLRLTRWVRTVIAGILLIPTISVEQKLDASSPWYLVIFLPTSVLATMCLCVLLAVHKWKRSEKWQTG
jgi:hypothetical protein